jgi:6-pyruvoyl tetrahydropterin synthase/QueD family protein
MTSTVTVRHNFETAHRLPRLGGKCTNLHGHSWWVEVTFEGTPSRDGVIADFGALKHALRAWVDGHLDHGAMLGVGDPLTLLLARGLQGVPVRRGRSGRVPG